MTEKLPPGWVLMRLENLCEFNPKHSKEISRDTMVSFIPMPAVDVGGQLLPHESRKLDEVWKGYTHFAENDVLFAKITPCMENGKIAVARGLTNGLGCGTTELHVLRTRGAVLPKYLQLFLRQQEFRQNAERAMTGAVGQRRVPAEYLKTFELPTPPLAEQSRIVAKLESLLDRCKKSRGELIRIPILVERYKQVVLRLAFEGDLSASWRAVNRDRSKTSMQALVEGAADNKRKITRVPLSPVELDQLPHLPVDWRWERMGIVASDMCLGKMLDQEKNRGVAMPYLRNLNVRWGAFELSDLQEMRFEENEEERYGIKRGDLIVCEGGEPGRAAVWNSELESMKIQKALHRVRFCEEVTDARFVMWFLKYAAQSGLLEPYITGTTIKHLTGKGLSKLPIPVLSKDEQEFIVREIETRFAVCERLEREIELASKRVSQLTESILQRAFSGKLFRIGSPGFEPSPQELLVTQS